MASHRFWTDRLSEYLDGALPSDQTAALEEHLVACADCRSVEAELREVHRRARALGGMEPPRDLWPDIRRRLDEESDVVDLTLRLEPPPAMAAPAHRVRERSSLLRVAAIAALVVGTGVAGWSLRGAVDGAAASAALQPAAVVDPTTDFAAREPGTDPLANDVAALERLLASAPAELDPGTVRILRENLVLIRRAVTESRSALEMDPDNAYVRNHLDQAVARQRAFVRQAAQLLAADD